MGLNVELLEESFAALAPQGDRLVELFYENLFNDYPSVVPLFAGVEPGEQRKKLLASLVLAVENLRKPDVLAPVLENMGRKHVEYGALADHYPAVGATLLKSMAEVASELWTPEVEEAWVGAYALISETMLHGASTPA